MKIALRANSNKITIVLLLIKQSADLHKFYANKLVRWTEQLYLRWRRWSTWDVIIKVYLLLLPNNYSLRKRVLQFMKIILQGEMLVKKDLPGSKCPRTFDIFSLKSYKVLPNTKDWLDQLGLWFSVLPITISILSCFVNTKNDNKW